MPYNSIKIQNYTFMAVNRLYLARWSLISQVLHKIVQKGKHSLIYVGLCRRAAASEIVGPGIMSKYKYFRKCAVNYKNSEKSSRLVLYCRYHVPALSIPLFSPSADFWP